MQEWIELLDKPLELFEKLQKNYHKDNESKESTIDILLTLNKEYDTDICELAVKAIDLGFKISDVFRILENAIPLMKLNITTLKTYLKKLYTAKDGGGVSGLQYNPIAELTKKQPQLSQELFSYFENETESDITGYITAILLNLPYEKFIDKHTEVFNLHTHANEFVIQGAVSVLGKLQYNIKKDHFFIDKTLNLFDKLLNENSEDLNRLITRAICDLYLQGIDSKDRILMLSKRNNYTINYQLSNFIFQNFEKISNEDWFIELFSSFSSTSYQYKDIIDNLDYALSNLMDNNEYNDYVEGFLLSWILQSDYSPTNNNLPKLFRSTINKIANNKNLFSKLITKSFNHDNPNVHVAVTEIIDYLSVAGQKSVSFDRSLLESYSFNDIFFICSKVLGYLFGIETLCSIIYSVLEAKSHDNRTIEFLKDLFINYLGLDYPIQLTEFLKTKLTTLEENEALYNYILSIIDVLDLKQKQYQELPRISELVTSKKQTYQISIEERKKMNKSMDETSKKSFYYQFIITIPLKYGRGQVGYYNGNFSEPTMLSSVSKSIALPSSEFYSPVSRAMQIFNFRTEKRHQK